ncbi:glycosyl transferase, group 1 [Aurantiacibacter atlanticus]|uniref:Glycosyl transferase, group 1 n=1 Tax=Aurantiacibacter atlanticus TaxID=1648404 RepID=A0A0H4VVD8_9SPHN|nr:glycosyltransferase [Aurantiacibacter atlanticus]AKQ40998.2 glycosyl transferase, group 1 [Aurantiacibacter atlanticus]
MAESAQANGSRIQPSGKLLRIVHLSTDFPDSLDEAKTPVIRHLIDLTHNQFDHHVVSINRRSPRVRDLGKLFAQAKPARRTLISSQPFSYGTAARYTAPGKGILHATMLKAVGRWLSELVATKERPDLLVAHKLTIEGIAVREAARQLDLPYAVCLQGNTDSKILKYRPDLRSNFADVLHNAEVVFPFTPWALQDAEAKLGQLGRPARFLPCPTDLDECLAPQITGSGLVSVFHLKNRRLKNLSGMVAAIRKLAVDNCAPRLRIIGGGSDIDVSETQAQIASVPQISLAGAMEREDVRSALYGSTGLVLPSHRESFGLVFLEALFAGAPVIYPKGTAIDGYFDQKSFAISVDANDPAAIAQAMRYLCANEARLKADLREWQGSAEARKFQRPAIATQFAQGLRDACGASVQ